MVRDDTLDGVDSRSIETDRLETHLLEAGDPDGHPVCFLHGNVSSSRFFEDAMVELGDEYRALAPDLRGYGNSETKPVDATKGLGEFAADVDSLRAALSIDDPMTIVGWSNGGGVALRYLLERPSAVEGVVLVNPLSPYGFGGTKDRDGTPCFPDYAGSGGGMANQEFVSCLEHGVRDEDGIDASPRTILEEFYVGPEYEFDRGEGESYLIGMLDTAIGDGNYPGSATESENWPGFAPGDEGVNNAISPKYCDLSGIVDLESKPRVLWLRGAADDIVSNESLFDLGTLGRIGEVPGWPGEDVFPPQPMVDQTRAVLESYSEGGGEYEEVVFEGVGHSPHVEVTEAFVRRVESLLPEA